MKITVNEEYNISSLSAINPDNRESLPKSSYQNTVFLGIGKEESNDRLIMVTELLPSV